MSRPARLSLFLIVAPAFAAAAAFFFLAVWGLPGFGSDFHPYGDRR